MAARILLIDDTPTVRFKYETILRREGYEVDGASGARAALRMLRERSDYDLVVSDLMMPEMDGNELLGAIRADGVLKMLPVLMLTGSDDEQDVLDNLGAGASDYVLKTCSVRELLARVKNLVTMKHLQDELKRASETDVLTDLANRRFGVDRLGDEMARSSRYGRPLSVVLIDIDHFKRVNDTLGHHAGDEVLMAVARELSKVSRDSDCIIRWGGEEFLFVFPETSAQDAAGIVDRFRKHLECNPIAVTAGGEDSVTVTVSGGVAELQPGDTLETLVDRADGALYRAKEAGRNRLLRWHEGTLIPV